MKHAPLYEALIQYKEKNKWPFHVPGHKAGKVFGSKGRELFQPLLTIDATELNGLDDLYHPDGVIKEAQQQLAAFYQVSNSYFLTGGSTSGILASILSSFRNGDNVLVQRNCHKSVLNGLELAGVQPVFLTPEMDNIGGYALGLRPEVVKQAVKEYPNNKGIILTNPTYYGLQQGIQEIVQEIHEYNGIVIVDEAHGAHFSLPKMPKSSIHSGADLIIQSAHKTLPALTMGAYLHVNSDRVSKQKLLHRLQMIQSSSPSYLIMASLDLSRLYLEELTEEHMGSILKQSAEWENYINSLPYLFTVPVPNGYEKDPLKFSVQTDRELSGYELQQMFERGGIFTELADDRNVLFVLPLGRMERIDELQRILLKVSQRLSDYKGRKHMSYTFIPYPPYSKLSVTYQEMGDLNIREKRLEDSEGDIAAEAVIPYPPGIPFIARGEKITLESIHQYENWKNSGARFQGISSDSKMYVFDR